MPRRAVNRIVFMQAKMLLGGLKVTAEDELSAISCVGLANR
jgi:hypothetical protein